MLFHLLVALLMQSSSAPKPLVWSAAIWPYKSLCSYTEPTSKPLQFKAIKPGKMQVVTLGCDAMQARFGHPTAVAIDIHNAGSRPEQARIAPLSQIALRTQKGQIVRTISAGFPHETEGLLHLITSSEVEWAVEIPPGSDVRLVYLFSYAEPGDIFRTPGAQARIAPPVK